MFAYADHFVGTTLLHDVPVVNENRQAVSASLERPFFRPALELLVAGLISGSGPLGKHTLAAGFAVSALDHLIMGWNALMLSYLRVAATLSRHVAESAIFEAASVFSAKKFAARWEENRATGGQVLKEVRSALPRDLAEDLQSSWKLVVSFGHVNPGVTWLSKLPGSVVGDPTRHAVTFDGPHNGPLPQHALVHVAMIFTALAETALRTFAASFNERLSSQWHSAFAAQNALILARRAERPAK
jgi:hypothetical protein